MSSSARTHYEILGIGRDADADEVRRAWKLQVQAWHPDRFSGEMQQEAEEKARDINAAYHALRDSGRRAAYDCKLAAEESAAEEAARPSRASNRVRGPQVPVRPSDRVGAPHVHAVSMEPQPHVLDQLSRDAMLVIRRHPRIIASIAACWVLLVGGAAAWSAVRGPELPADFNARPVSSNALAVDARTTDQGVDEFQALATQAKRDADAYDAEVAKQLAADARAQARADALLERQMLADAAKAAKVAKASKGAKGTAARPAGRIIRVTPNQPVL